ncbi:metalloprotease family protein [Staphylococcus pseudintermedius]|uniref:metalloprotease family protein n=1 Tax=Staphylococcus pseudintermedius TaxID=283734 RepID=UPI00103588E7|nr:metalloprotease family protein [Staphylococcus pseudintermedius]EGQ3129994.1 hypothetical protein [Staphylococcus pseudintermedius]EGQ3158134.1 hypothetical protein [Staphylococcus pseudintermedius]EGQ3815584.1 hypothetical protein [Staphylococcus pseudintermedius]EGQ3932844.1 hypothetical protein [Staphylococcus pseudintermedius]EHT8095616.1 DUF3267 domain-containing protein [Staphylococcus pseudintermedius]
MSLIIVILKILFDFLFVAFIHESTHLICAKLYRRKDIKINVNKLFVVSVSYKNNHNSFQNLVIAASAPFICVSLGLILLILGYLNILTLVFLSNIFNFLPVTQDGQIILISIINILKSNNNDE